MNEFPRLSADDTQHLTRCIELAGEARGRGDNPIGALLVAGSGEVLREDSNRVVTTANPFAHPEFTLATWSLSNLTAKERARSTIHTSTEHCPMCFGGAYFAGIGRLVFAVSAEQLRSWRKDRVNTIGVSIHELAAATTGRSIAVAGPDPSLEQAGNAVHRGYWFEDA
jgi:tRNA(Arg) A34 adenosine deaminase TadA